MAKGSILVTGCSSGIGLDAARTLKQRGWRVIASCRQEADCERLRAEGFESPRLDYTDEASIAETVAAAGPIDALFNNGAYAIPGALEDLPRGALRAIFEANLFGPFDLIARVIPGMRARGAGRIVNCSSVLGFSALRYRGAYCGTKHAMEGMTDALRLELAGTGIHAILIEPGPIATDIRIKSRPHFERWIDWENSARREEYERLVRPRLYATDGKKDRYEMTPAAVTQKLIHALESPRPAPRYFVTTPTWYAAILKRLAPTRLSDRIFRTQ